ncbi:MAG: AMP-binding protein, partial [Candidatus Bipolaricaulota bacterium]|nr:AMP-binding protein [Candidatus Bipolaricaulota bacterium]
MAHKFAWTPTREYIEQSNVWRFMQKHQIKDYTELVRRSTEEIEWFWDAVVKDLEIEFFEPYKRVLDVSEGIAWAKWFVGGKINIAHNCVEKHARTRPEKLALIWEGEDGSVRRVTYRELSEQTNRLTYILKERGIAKGDRVGIFMPMVPETVVAMMACAKLGAIFTPIFSGFGAQAVAARLNDCEAKLLLTAESFSRKGVRIEMEKIAREAQKLCPTVKEVMVVQALTSPSGHPSPVGHYGRGAGGEGLALRVRLNIEVQHLEHLIALGLRSGFGDDTLKLGAIKFFADGSIGARNAALHRSYRDADGFGKLNYEQNDLNRLVQRAHDHGFQVM